MAESAFLFFLFIKNDGFWSPLLFTNLDFIPLILYNFLIFFLEGPTERCMLHSIFLWKHETYMLWEVFSFNSIFISCLLSRCTKWLDLFSPEDSCMLILPIFFHLSLTVMLFSDFYNYFNSNVMAEWFLAMLILLMSAIKLLKRINLKSSNFSFGVNTGRLWIAMCSTWSFA